MKIIHDLKNRKSKDSVRSVPNDLLFEILGGIGTTPYIGVVCYKTLGNMIGFGTNETRPLIWISPLDKSVLDWEVRVLEKGETVKLENI